MIQSSRSSLGPGGPDRKDRVVSTWDRISERTQAVSGTWEAVPSVGVPQTGRKQRPAENGDQRMNRVYPEGLTVQDKRHIDALDAIRAALRSELPEPTGDHRGRRAIENRNYDIMDTRVQDFDAELSRARVEMSQLALTPEQRFELQLRDLLRDDLEGRHSSEDEQLVDEAVETVIESLENMRIVVELGEVPISELESEALETERLQVADGAVPIDYATWEDERDEINADRARALEAVAQIDARLEVLDEIAFQEMKANDLEPALDEPHSRGVLGD